MRAFLRTRTSGCWGFAEVVPGWFGCCFRGASALWASALWASFGSFSFSRDWRLATRGGCSRGDVTIGRSSFCFRAEGRRLLVVLDHVEWRDVETRGGA